MANTPRRRGLLRVAAVLAGLLAAAGAAELTLRITHWGVYGPRANDYRFRQHEPDAGYKYLDPAEPTTHVWDRDPYGRLPPGARMTYELNSRGLRGHEPLPGRSNVLLVGDSFTFGEGVAMQDTFAARIERSLASRLAPPVQVVDAGVPGYGSAEELARLPSLLDEYRPRAVVVVYVPNDPIPIDEEIGRADLLAVSHEPPALYLGRLVSTFIRRSATDRATERWYESYYFGEKRAAWEAARGALADMKRRSVAAGAKFGVVVFPLLYRLGERPFAKIHEAVAAACAEMGAPTLDLTPVLAREPDHALWVHPTDHHPDARAHELAAAAMTPFVEALLR